MTNEEKKEAIYDLQISTPAKPMTLAEFDRYMYIICEVIDVLKQTRWIPVSESLPEDGTWNIWQSTTGALSIERYKEDAYDHFCPSGRFFSFEDTVAWMPLPERYKGGEEE